MLMIQKKGKILGALIVTALYGAVMGSAYTTDTKIRDSFMQITPAAVENLPQADPIFHETIRELSPFIAFSAAAHKDGANTHPGRALPSIPNINFPRPNIPVITARPVTLPQEAMQGTAENASASHSEVRERKYSDPIAFIQSGNGSTQPSDAITYYGGEGSHFSADSEKSKEQQYAADK